jgi:hypothetical protein
MNGEQRHGKERTPRKRQGHAASAYPPAVASQVRADTRGHRRCLRGGIVRIEPSIQQHMPRERDPSEAASRPGLLRRRRTCRLLRPPREGEMDAPAAVTSKLSPPDAGRAPVNP